MCNKTVDRVVGTRHASGYVRDAGGTAAARCDDGRSGGGWLHVPPDPTASAALPTGTTTPATGRSGQVLVDCMGDV